METWNLKAGDAVKDIVELDSVVHARCGVMLANPVPRRFGGEPFVDEATGGLLYRFEALQTGAVELRREAAQVRVPLERELEFSAAEPGGVAWIAVTLGWAREG